MPSYLSVSINSEGICTCVNLPVFIYVFIKNLYYFFIFFLATKYEYVEKYLGLFLFTYISDFDRDVSV